MQHDFKISREPEPHRERTRKILADHPEMKKLQVRNIWTFAILVVIVAGQLLIAWQLAGAPWWLVLGVAFFVGAFANHALFVVIHECCHALIFKRRWANRLAGIFANLPMFLPSSASFETYHLKHHAFQGVLDLDADLPSAWEIKMFGFGALGKALWLAIYPIILALRPARLKTVPLVNRWVVLNLIVVFVFDVLVFNYWGGMSLAYFALSLFFSVGLHPVGGRWIQEHFLIAPPQETYSYYGPLNKIALNVGYHNEHHDFMQVPWNKLPEIKAIAPEAYDNLYAHYSWTKLVLKFVFEKDLRITSRMVRESRKPVMKN